MTCCLTAFSWGCLSGWVSQWKLWVHCGTFSVTYSCALRSAGRWVRLFFRTNCGVQGDALICICLSVLVMVWIRAVEQATAPLGCVEASAYADDQSLVATGAPLRTLGLGMRIAPRETDAFVRLTG